MLTGLGCLSFQSGGLIHDNVVSLAAVVVVVVVVGGGGGGGARW